LPYNLVNGFKLKKQNASESQMESEHEIVSKLERPSHSGASKHRLSSYTVT